MTLRQVGNGRGGSGGQPPFDPEELLQRVLDYLRRNPAAILIVALILLAILFLPTVVYQVDRDEQAVVTRLGAYERLEPPGLNFKLPPPFERVEIVNTRRVFSVEFGFRTVERGVRSERRRQGYDQEAFMLTGDLGIARVEWVVQYRRAEPRNFVFNVQDEERLIRDASEEAVRRVVGDYDATEVITVARVTIAQQVRRELQSIMDKYNSGILIDDLLIQSTEPPAPVAPAFQEVDSARQDQERLRLEAEAVEERVIPEARGRAERIIREAEGDATRFTEILQEYRRFPEVTRHRLLLERMEEVLGRSERIYVVDHGVRSILPLMDLELEPKRGTQ